jgi:hypothetical protein
LSETSIARRTLTGVATADSWPRGSHNFDKGLQAGAEIEIRRSIAGDSLYANVIMPRRNIAIAHILGWKQVFTAALAGQTGRRAVRGLRR